MTRKMWDGWTGIAGALALALTVGVGFAGPASALMAYSQDFEGLDEFDSSALANDGWWVFGNAYDTTGFGVDYGYGPFTAPNHAQAFSALVPGEGGPNQGNLVLSAFSDYNNVDHGNGYVIESNLFQEQIISALDVGTTWRFEFDAKPLAGLPQPPTTTLAFIKTIDLGVGLTNFLTLETTNYPSLWQEGLVIDVDIDASMVGSLLQFGFLSETTSFEASGVFYDNVSFSIVPEPTTALLLGLGLAGLAVRRGRARAA